MSAGLLSLSFRPKRGSPAVERPRRQARRWLGAQPLSDL